MKALKAAGLAAAVLGSAAGVWCLRLPDPRALKKRFPEKTAFMELAEEKARENGRPFRLKYRPVPLSEISPHLVHAVLLAEDAGFYLHHGVDWTETKVALQRDWEAKRFAYGGSTLTQQLARNLYLSPSKNPLRKLAELVIARRLEDRLGKRRILELYLNVAQWGDGVYGAEAAAQAHFHKSAASLTPEEAVALAVALPSPRKYSPEKDGKYLGRQRGLIYERMLERGYLDDELLSASTSTAPAPSPLPRDAPRGL